MTFVEFAHEFNPLEGVSMDIQKLLEEAQAEVDNIQEEFLLDAVSAALDGNITLVYTAVEKYIVIQKACRIFDWANHPEDITIYELGHYWWAEYHGDVRKVE